MADQDVPPEQESPQNSEHNTGEGGQNEVKDAYGHVFDLIMQPTVALWKMELEYLAQGERADQLSRVGDARYHVKSLLDEMDDPALGKATFFEALAEFILQWQPSIIENAESLNVILSLIIAFNPTPGFSKIADYLKRANWFDQIAHPPVGPDAQIDLHMKALVALRSYHRTASPNTSDSAFQTYLRILRLHLSYPRYFGFAAAQLIDLDQLGTDDPRLIEGLRRHLVSLREIIPVLLAPHWRDNASRDLGRIYTYCHNVGEPAIALFKQVIEENGGHISRDQQIVFRGGREEIVLEPEPVVVMPDDSEIEITLSEEQMVEYVESSEPEPLAQVNPTLHFTELKGLVEQHILQYIHEQRKAGEEIGWEKLDSDLGQKGISLGVSREVGQGYITLGQSEERYSLNLPPIAFELLLKAYYSLDPQEVGEKLFAKANSAR